MRRNPAIAAEGPGRKRGRGRGRGRSDHRRLHSLAPLLALALLLSVAACQRVPLADGLPDKLGCSSCHGSPANAAPPGAVNGDTSTNTIAVGAHQPHMLGSSLAGAVACSECHVVPTAMNGTDHPDPLGRVAPVVFGVLANKSPAEPAWDRKAKTCAGTYCHGATLRGGKERPPPVWTKVDGSQVQCDSCHGNPPGGTHPSDSRCEACHGDVVDAGGIVKNPSLHVNGIVELVTSNSMEGPVGE
jgi:predicted CxxxxCH...CXXCH cytochrome family protein